MVLLFSSTGTSALLVVVMFLLLLLPLIRSAEAEADADAAVLPKTDVDLLEFPLNLEYLEADFFSWGALGRGIDSFEPNLTKGGPPPLGVKKANLKPLTRDIIAQFAFQEFGHLRFFFFTPFLHHILYSLFYSILFCLIN